MNLLFVTVLFFINVGGDEVKKSSGIHKIALINKEKKLAHAAYTQEKFDQSFIHYSVLTDSFKVSEPEIWLNKGHAAFRIEKYPEARQAYTQASLSTDLKIASIAWQQLGLIELQQQKKEQALEMFKKSMMVNPRNEDARYNYELALKQKQQDQQQKDQNKEDKKEEQKKQDQQKEEQQKKEQTKEEEKQDQNQSESDQKKEQEKESKEKPQKEGKEDKESEEETSPKNRQEQFKEINISEEKAKMLLDAMKNSEKQYLQQLKKQATKPKDKSIKDW